ncbi:MAG: 4-hydroxythreonine-4-phosphate dehydrogenase PdxA [Steroidobacteraceae bacterium]
MLAQQLQREDRGYDVLCLADATLLQERAALLGLPAASSARFSIEHIPLAVPARAGTLDPANAHYVLALLDCALALCNSAECAAMCTAPVQKSVINDAGIAFTGHTEYLAERCGNVRPVMLLVAQQLRVALATTHLPLRAVSHALTAEVLDDTLRIIDNDMRRYWKIAAPRIAVCGLNPHAGESGHLGQEEAQVIAPAIARARVNGIKASGPYPADTIFVPQRLRDVDVVLAMYHDQGLPTLKYAGFGNAVNVTLGLPIVRTSVDHGTALDIAGTGRADAGSLAAALELAAAML